MAATISMEELEKLCEEKEAESMMDFEDLVYHETIGILKRSADELWMSDKATVRLDMKSNISAAIRILEHWDDLKEN